MDFIFVDASHTYEYVLSDSNAALQMLAPGGVIFWHDYSDVWQGVKRALAQIARSRRIFSINGTGMALYIDR
jgi:hypothetical protein